MVEGVTASRPSRHPNSGMSSFARHSASSIAFHSRMGASTRGIALGSPHISVRLHTSVWEKSPPPVSVWGKSPQCQSVHVSANKADSDSTMQSKGEQCPSPSHSPILALPDLVLGANSPLVSAPLVDSDQAGLAVPASGQDLASSTRALEVVGMAHTGPRALMNNLPVEVQETIASARAPATRKLYSSKWGVFESWCLARAIDPVNYPVGPVLEFLQERLTAGAAATTLRVYVAAIAARRELDEIPLGRHRMVSAFMRGVRQLRPTRPTAVPSWDLSVVLEGLVMAPFEPLQSAPERILTLKITLLLALTSLKRVGDLQALSVSEMCMDFVPGLVNLILRH